MTRLIPAAPASLSLALTALLTMLVCLLGSARAQELRKHAEEARAVLKEGIDSKDSAVRIEAITAVGMIGCHELVLARLTGLLQDKNIGVRLAAIHVLADLGSRSSIAPLQQVLHEDKTPEVAFAAAKALDKLHDPEGRKALVDVFDGQRKSSSGMLEKEMRETTGQFHSLSSAMIFVVSRGIGYVPVPGVGEGYSAMSQLLHDADLSDRAAVVMILGKEHNAEASALLRRALADKDWSVRAAATQMIADGARTDLRDDLLPLFSDSHRKVRFRAAGAFLHLALIRKQ